VNTTGFKRSRAEFEDLLYQQVQGTAVIGTRDANTLPSIQVGRGTHLAAVQRVHTQGSFETTNRPLDVAIEGEGFFQVQMPNGQVGYTRDGSFEVSDTGTIVTQSGYTVVPGIKVPTGSANLTISATGVVSVQRNGETTPTEIGRIELARFVNPAGLEAAGGNVYRATPASGEPSLGFPQDEGIGQLEQGALEASNVEIVQEMVDMISAMRAYEINSKSIKNSEEMQEIANQLVR
jgi:flagellar basal-body rod protein FlgG